jgi:hypothetical protein
VVVEIELHSTQNTVAKPGKLVHDGHAALEINTLCYIYIYQSETCEVVNYYVDYPNVALFKWFVK